MRGKRAPDQCQREFVACPKHMMVVDLIDYLRKNEEI